MTAKKKVELIVKYNVGVFKDFADLHKSDEELGREIRKIINKDSI